MKHVKICGLTNKIDIENCINFGATALGFVYNVPESPRNLEKRQLIPLLEEIPGNVKIVVVVRARNSNDIQQVLEEVKVNYYQIHGIKDLKELEKFSENERKKFIVALKVNPTNKEEVIKQINAYHQHFHAFLLDSSEGNGILFGREIITEVMRRINHAKLIIAGGINEDNVEDLIKTLRPFGIDVSSSLESKKGVKDPEKIKNFLTRVNKVKQEIQGGK